MMTSYIIIHIVFARILQCFCFVLRTWKLTFWRQCWKHLEGTKPSIWKCVCAEDFQITFYSDSAKTPGRSSTVTVCVLRSAKDNDTVPILTFSEGIYMYVQDRSRLGKSKFLVFVHGINLYIYTHIWHYILRQYLTRRSTQSKILTLSKYIAEAFTIVHDSPICNFTSNLHILVSYSYTFMNISLVGWLAI
jgi:hypothetical protein